MSWFLVDVRCVDCSWIFLLSVCIFLVCYCWIFVMMFCFCGVCVLVNLLFIVLGVLGCGLLGLCV